MVFQSPFTKAAAALIAKDDVDPTRGQQPTIQSTTSEAAFVDPIANILRNLRCAEMSKYIHSKLKVPAHPQGNIEKQVSESITLDIKRIARLKQKNTSPVIGHTPGVGIVGGQRRVKFAKKIHVKCFTVECCK